MSDENIEQQLQEKINQLETTLSQKDAELIDMHQQLSHRDETEQRLVFELERSASDLKKLSEDNNQMLVSIDKTKRQLELKNDYLRKLLDI
ncbi:hypothetical protein AB832_07375 [Flavobacteriaceae bacterium (ex Bugula neritina AB1)]|nr:hypothetical protein AB832_07375 [Flavobacteriaceae bacterium (ex Bugula neritina AB1)]